MIYDGHSYTIPDQRGDLKTLGFDDRQQFTRHLQLAMATDPQPVWRARDRTPADSSALLDLSGPISFHALKEANFRPAGHGRFMWTSDGEDYVKQVQPPSMIEHTFSAESLVAEMDYAGVDWSLIHRTPYQGAGNEYFADCVKRFPNRLHSLALVDEWLVQQQPEASISRLRKAIDELGLHGLQWHAAHPYYYGQTEPWDSDAFRPFWNAVAELGIPVFFTIGGAAHRTLDRYLDGLKTLRRWMDRYADVTVVLTHGFSWRMFARSDGIEVPDVVYSTAPIEKPNFHVQLLFAVMLGGDFDYPMPQMRTTLKQLTQRIGADRLLWSTDIPYLLRHYTYRQSIDSIRTYCDFLTSNEKDQILGDNMARIMGLSE